MPFHIPAKVSNVLLQLGVCELHTGIQGEESLSSSHRGGVGESAVQVPLTE